MGSINLIKLFTVQCIKKSVLTINKANFFDFFKDFLLRLIGSACRLGKGQNEQENVDLTMGKLAQQETLIASAKN